MPYCTDCGGKLNWDRKLRMYSCESCGLTFTEAQLSRAIEKLYERPDDEDEKKQCSTAYHHPSLLLPFRKLLQQGLNI